MARPLRKGIYTPLPTFFNNDEDLDLQSFKSHVRYTALAGTVPVVAGSAGEAAHLVRHYCIHLPENRFITCLEPRGARNPHQSRPLRT